ncbi:MAG: hypothetical protein RH917_15695 [Lacipirellulaceae bacterium]
MRTTFYGFLTYALVLASSSAQGQLLVDDFNDGSTSGWTIQNGTITESGGVFYGTDESLATLDGVSSSSLGVDAIANPGTDYVALVLNYNSLSDNLFIKIQDNDANGLFDRVFFYTGNNGVAAFIGSSFFDLSSQVGATYFQATDNGDGTATAYVEATGEFFSGTLNSTYTGTGAGIGFYGNGEADNYYLGIPEPTTCTLALAALCLLGCRRR